MIDARSGLRARVRRPQKRVCLGIIHQYLDLARPGDDLFGGSPIVQVFAAKQAVGQCDRLQVQAVAPLAQDRLIPSSQ